jgi:4-amino-4-deoxy-L-arabinose transferase-like glycosyltransferase
MDSADAATGSWGPSRAWRTLAELAAVFAVALLLRIPIAAIPLERDEGEYAYIGQRWVLGEVPYKTSFDQKPPGVFAAYAVIEALIGTSPAALHWGTQLYTLGTLALLFVLGRLLFSPTVGLLAALFAAFLTADKGVLGNAANTEIFMLLPLTAAMLTTLRAVQEDSPTWALSTGVLCWAALLCKQAALFDVVFYLGVLVWLGRRRWALARALIVGLVVGMLPVLVYFATAGAWKDFVDCTVGYNVSYARDQALAEYPRAFWNKFSVILETAGPVYALAVAGVVGGWLLPPREGRVARPGRLVAVWLAFSCVGVTTGGYFREHYFMQIIPALAVLAAVGAATLAGLLPSRWPRAVLPWAVAAAVIAYAVVAAPRYWLPGSPDEKSRLLYLSNPFPESAEVARYVAELSDPADPIFVFGSEPQIYYYARRKCASRYIFMYPLTMALRNTRDRQRACLEDLYNHPPRFIIRVDSGPSFLWHDHHPPYLERGLGELLENAYQWVAAVVISEETPMPLVTERRPGVVRTRMRVYKRK